MDSFTSRRIYPDMFGYTWSLFDTRRSERLASLGYKTECLLRLV